MRRVGSAAGVVLAALLLAGLAGLGVWAIIRGVEKDPAVVATMVTAVGALVGVAIQRRWEKTRELDRLRREEMVPLYEELIETFREPPGPDKAAEFFKRWSTKIMVHGPAPVVKAWLAWNRSFSEDDPLNLLRWETVLFAIRADLGHDNKGLHQGDLLRLYINDVDEHLAVWRADGTLPEGKP